MTTDAPWMNSGIWLHFSAADTKSPRDMSSRGLLILDQKMILVVVTKITAMTRTNVAIVVIVEGGLQSIDRFLLLLGQA